MNYLIKINEKIGTLEWFVIGMNISIIALLLILNVLSRLLGNNIAYAEEVCQWLVISNTFIGLSHNARRGNHIVMSAIYDNISQRGQKIFSLISSSFSSVASCYLCYLSVQYVESVYAAGRVSGSLQFPMWIPYSMVPIGFALAALQYFIIFYQNLKDPVKPLVSVQSLDPSKNINEIEIDGVVVKATIDEGDEQK